MANAWIKHLTATRKKLPKTTSFKDAIKAAKKTYKPVAAKKVVKRTVKKK